MAILNTNETMFTAFEPKLQNRFIMVIDGIPAYLIKKISRPQISFGEVVLDHINVKRKIKGKANWENITCDLYDPVTPSGAQAVWSGLDYLMNQLRVEMVILIFIKKTLELIH